MDTSAEFLKVKEKERLGSPVSTRDMAIAIANDEETLLSFLVHNDPHQVYALLHHSSAPLVIGDSANFFPDQKRAAAELKSLLAKGEFNTLNDIISSFALNPNAKNYTADGNVLKDLENIGAIKLQPSGYYSFTLKYQ